jgi:hypothetical protein
MPSNKYSLCYVLNKPKNLPKHKEFRLEEHLGLAEMSRWTGRSSSEQSRHSSPSEQSSRCSSMDNSEMVEIDCPKEVGASSLERTASPPEVALRISPEQRRSWGMRGVSPLPFTPDFANKYVGRRGWPPTGERQGEGTSADIDANVWLLQ